MTRAGPALETLLRRLADTPPDFLDEPRIGGAGRIVVPAVVNDLLRLHGARATLEALRPFAASAARAERNRLALVLVVAWLLADDWFVAAQPGQEALLRVLAGVPAELAPAAAAPAFVEDGERREELARVVLAGLDVLPGDETAAQAADRLAAISATERRRLLDASRAAEERARAIREALAKKVADESADKWTRE
ncbi:hypothetical protein [uncultured Massilia sp.]|uniref:hypothetical protein n=1 Tax=uncultured Massilia sp. TaxID=169973 RepID=UPI0025DDA14D|nr:hypothetical protein [uncultured Massilia sp.]